ncbi:phasin family protein [Telluria mixta]|uniref:Phasin family protein n=1 Tax=Telluria mixta TaxID=34071 RepID=A0ABT2C052_9BURK|nr:phasin family protein [Telluria mixta]MCS0630762.1 phasin family protein [Telluria mixta]WEM98766.1 phasin family protein [Telluria mixta]
MTSFSEQLSAVRKSQWEAQLDVFRALSQRALDSAEQLIALNMKTSRASVEQATGTFKQLLEITNPRDLIAIGSSAQGQWQQFFSYGRELLGIAAGTHERSWSTQAPLQLVPAATANIPTSVPQILEQAAIATAEATTVSSEIARAAADTGSALAEAALDAGKQAVAAVEAAPAAPQAEAQSELKAPEPITTTVTEAVAAEPEAPAADPVETAIADDVPHAKAKPLAKALNKVAPKPAGAEHPIASTVPLEAGPHVELPIVTPTESTPPLRVVTHGGKTSRTPRKK